MLHGDGFYKKSPPWLTMYFIWVTISFTKSKNNKKDENEDTLYINRTFVGGRM
jgi:hypothetical protein